MRDTEFYPLRQAWWFHCSTQILVKLGGKFLVFTEPLGQVILHLLDGLNLNFTNPLQN